MFKRSRLQVLNTYNFYTILKKSVYPFQMWKEKYNVKAPEDVGHMNTKSTTCEWATEA